MASDSYSVTLDWLFSQLPMFSRVGAPAYKAGLETTLRLDEIFGHPHNRFKSIHVAGTNGKGSTSHSLAAVLQAQGYRTGLYTSPHLTDFRERIRVNGKMIPREAVVDFVDRWRNQKADIHPSFFELTMMMAFDWFAKSDVDYAVIEVGMGGRLDSTNIITPLLSVITNISYDHTQFLGNSLEAIAGEKAGIIKPGIPVVIGEAEGAVKTIFEQKAAETHSPIYFAEDNRNIVFISKTDDGWECRLSMGEIFSFPLAGNYQSKNLRTIMTTLDVLKNLGMPLSQTSIRNGLANADVLTGLRGRWQKVSDSPVVICDTGHNIDGLKENLATLRSRYPNRKYHFVLGFVNDKDVEHIVGLFPKDGIYFFTQAKIPRAMDATEVAAKFSASGISGKVIPCVAEAYKEALKRASADDVIYVGGSTFVVADFLDTPK